MLPIGPSNDMLPPSFSLSSSGLISGNTTSTGSYSFLLHVEDSASHVVEKFITLNVNDSSGRRITNRNPSDTWVGGVRDMTLTTNTPASDVVWTVNSGALPPGVSLVPNYPDTNQTSLAGAPSAPGTYTFTLQAASASTPFSLKHAFTYKVSPAQIVAPALERLNVFWVPPGKVGTPYGPFTLKAAGGTTPYTFTESPFAPLPPGLTLSSSGVLSGTPTNPGTYFIDPIVTDTGGPAITTFGFQLVIIAASQAAAPLYEAGEIFRPAVGRRAVRLRT